MDRLGEFLLLRLERERAPTRTEQEGRTSDTTAEEIVRACRDGIPSSVLPLHLPKARERRRTQTRTEREREKERGADNE